MPGGRMGGIIQNHSSSSGHGCTTPPEDDSRYTRLVDSSRAPSSRRLSTSSACCTPQSLGMTPPSMLFKESYARVIDASHVDAPHCAALDAECVERGAALPQSCARDSAPSVHEGIAEVEVISEHDSEAAQTSQASQSDDSATFRKWNPLLGKQSPALTDERGVVGLPESSYPSHESSLLSRVTIERWPSDPMDPCVDTSTSSFTTAESSLSGWACLNSEPLGAGSKGA